MTENKHPVVFFVHIPKTGGNTIRNMAERQFPKSEICWLMGVDGLTLVEEFKNKPEEVRAGYRLVRGHIPFGLHEHVAGETRYFTILRDPIERVISGYYDIYRRKEHFLHHRIAEAGVTLEEFLDGEVITAIDNGQTRLLSGDHDTLDVVRPIEGQPEFDIQIAPIGFGECSRDLLDRAKQNLEEHFDVVGLTERFDETMLLVRREFGWSLPYGRKQNVGTNKPKRDAIAPQVLEKVQAMNELDVELYDFAVELFERKIAAQGREFHQELRLVRSINRFAGGDDLLARGLRFLRRRVQRG